MVAKEERVFRSTSKKCTLAEARNKLFLSLISQKTGVKEMEDYVRKEIDKCKGGIQFSYVKSRKIVVLLMKEKYRDNVREGVKLRNERDLVLEWIISSMSQSLKI